MAGSITSAVLQRIYSDTFWFEFNWTGTPVGVLSLQVSGSYNPQGPAGNGTWTTLPTSLYVPAIVQPAGGAGSSYIEIPQSSAPYIRAVYTRTSGTGSLNVWTGAKAL